MTEITVTPSAHDFTAMHDRMQFYVDEGILPCVATLVLDGTDVVDHRTFGYMDLESKEPLRDDAIFRIFSNSKIVTAVAAMQLYEQGKFRLDDPLSDHLPAFADMQVLVPEATAADQTEPAKTPILLRQVLSHSAGFSYGFIEPMSVIDQAYGAGGISLMGGSDADLEEFCERLAALPLAYQPGTKWRYSVASDVLARLVEVWSGQAFDEYLHDHIFEPLGMVDTGFFVPEAKRDRFTAMYSPTNLFDPMEGGLAPSGEPFAGMYDQRPTLLSGGGGLVSTVGDYLTFVRMLVNGGTWNDAQILRHETIGLMRTNQLPQDVVVNFPMWSMPGTTFGLGFALKESLEGDDHEGRKGEYHWGGMAGTHTWMSPVTGLTGFCWTQRMPGFWHPFSHDFRDLVYGVAG